ncbi:alpha-lytic protease prodomain-containing protein [Streptomyces sp. NPDC058470]|uniref:alpha-lytic protease prodomain-containing protein n=1 Tax=Streptomyces sp. NPDC058470 TaxID=3346515 RepID=UPI003646A616
MRRTTVLRSCLSATLLLSTVAAGVGTQASAAETPTAADSAPASAGLITAMQRDLGLTETQATARLKAEATARTVEGAAERAAGGSYGGSWFEAESGELTVAITDNARRQAVETTGARVTLVEHSERQHDAAMARIDKLDAPSGVSGWHVDPKSSSVVVDVVAAQKNDNDVQAFVTQARQAGPVTLDAASPRQGTGGRDSPRPSRTK